MSEDKKYKYQVIVYTKLFRNKNSAIENAFVFLPENPSINHWITENMNSWLNNGYGINISRSDFFYEIYLYKDNEYIERHLVNAIPLEIRD